VEFNTPPLAAGRLIQEKVIQKNPANLYKGKIGGTAEPLRGTGPGTMRLHAVSAESGALGPKDAVQK
jgi:hypothetical protein